MAKEYGELYPWGGRDDQWVLETGSSVPLSDDDGKMRTWGSALKALNELAEEGWELVSAASQSEADHPGRIHVRFFLARERKGQPETDVWVPTP